MAAARESVTSTPLLTVVLVVRDAAPQVTSVITNILTQAGVALELLVVDDGSEDETAGIVGGVSDPRVRLLRLAGPRGMAHCWNRALEMSRSPYLTIVDVNDRLLGSALADLVAALEQDPAVALAHAYWFPVDETGRITLEAFRRHRRRMLRQIPPDLDHRRALADEGEVIQALPTYRREEVVAASGFDESLGDNSTSGLALRLLDRSGIRVVPRFLCSRPDSTLAGTGRSWLLRIRGIAERAYWRVRRILRRISPVRLLRESLGSGHLYQLIVDRMAWWPLARLAEAPPGGLPVRVAYVLWGYPLISETFIRREIHALRAAGVSVDVIADAAGEGRVEHHPAAPAGEVYYLNPIDPARARRLARGFLRLQPLRLLNLFLYTVFHRYAGRKTLRGDVRMLRKAMYLAGMLRERGATHVHAPWADQHAFLAMLASRLLGLPYSVQARAYEIHRSSAVFALADKLQNAKFVVTNSAFNAAHLAPVMGEGANSSLHSIYNGIDLTQFRPSPRGGEATNPLRLLTVGRLVEQKGFDDLLRACALLRDRGLEFRCDIIGGPREPEDTNHFVLLGKLHRQLSLEGLVYFQGELPFSRILDAYQAADIFVLPCVVASHGGSDVTPNVLLEAMAMELPVVSTPGAGIPEIVTDGTSGLLVPSRNPDALADALAMLLGDAELRIRLGTAGRQRIEERFDIAKNIRRYVSLFVPSGSEPPRL